MEYLRKVDYKDLINCNTEIQKLHDFLNNNRRIHDIIVNLFEGIPSEVC